MIEIKSNYAFKICLFGGNNVGKSSLIQAFTLKEFNNERSPSAIIGIEVKRLTINSHEIVLQIWILRFDFHLEPLFSIFLRGASGGIFMFDITEFTSIDNVEKWITPFKASQSNDRKEIPLIMVGGKSDLYFKRAIPEQYAKEISQKYNFHHYFECSAKTGENIDEIFNFLIRKIMEIENETKRIRVCI